MQSMRDETGICESDQRSLLDVAEQTIQAGLKTRRLIEAEVATCSDAVRRIQGSFVTLRTAGGLRGCVGAVEAAAPLVVDVGRHAFGAAFRDVRFPALRDDEFPDLTIHVSVLSPLRQIPARTLAEALEHIRPARHGVVLQSGTRKATFLPDVWATLQDPVEFFRQLRMKAGLLPDAWSPDMLVACYTTQRFSRSGRRALRSSSGNG
jgi:AmmeMemoRadiSam system protein A